MPETPLYNHQPDPSLCVRVSLLVARRSLSCVMAISRENTGPVSQRTGTMQSSARLPSTDAPHIPSCTSLNPPLQFSGLSAAQIQTLLSPAALCASLFRSAGERVSWLAARASRCDHGGVSFRNERPRPGRRSLFIRAARSSHSESTQCSPEPSRSQDRVFRREMCSDSTEIELLIGAVAS